MDENIEGKYIGLKIERQFNVPPEAVYNAWTDPEILVQWWGPQGMTTPVYDLNVHEGGSWTTTMENSDGNRVTTSGIYLVLEPPNRLVFTWAWTGEDGLRGHETEVEIKLKRTGTGTLMTLTQGAFESTEFRDNHNSGWSSSFKDLEKTLA